MSELKTTVSEQLQQLQMLMHRASFGRFGKMYNPHRGQGRVLAILKLKPEISQKELSYLLNMSKQAVAELIGKLEKSGYVTREPSAEDKRAMTIRLTEAGAKAADSADDAAPESEKMLDCLNDEELAAFSEYLGRVIRQYEEQFPGEDFAQRREKMEAFMSFHGHGFAHGHPHDCRHAGRGHHFPHGFGMPGHPGHGCKGHGPHHEEDAPSFFRKEECCDGEDEV